jgi:hypothetical protein
VDRGKGGRFEMMSCGENNPAWKACDVQNNQLHYWVRKHWPGPITTKCKICKLEKKLELCNISSTYNKKRIIETSIIGGGAVLCAIK